MTNVLSCDDLSVGYGKLTVARGLDLEADAGEIVALLGPNGAGKTTTLLTIAGILTPLDGGISVAGEPLRPGSARAANKVGVVLVPDTRALFTGLTTVENLRIASRNGGPSVDTVLDYFPLLAARSRLRAGMLSGGEQQMLAVARALVQQPRVLLIDEMSTGLAPIVVEQLMPIVRNIADDSGAAVVLVEQHVHLALDVADKAIVLVHGDVTLAGSAAELRADPSQLETAYLGSQPEAPTPDPAAAQKAKSGSQ